MAARDDPLRSGALFRVESGQYPALRSPVPRAPVRGSRLARPVAVYANDFGLSSPSVPHETPTIANRRRSDEMMDGNGIEKTSTASATIGDVHSRFRDLCSASPLPRVFLSRVRASEWQGHTTDKTNAPFVPQLSPSVSQSLLASSRCDPNTKMTYGASTKSGSLAAGGTLDKVIEDVPVKELTHSIGSEFLDEGDVTMPEQDCHRNEKSAEGARRYATRDSSRQEAFFADTCDVMCTNTAVRNEHERSLPPNIVLTRSREDACLAAHLPRQSGAIGRRLQPDVSIPMDDGDPKQTDKSLASIKKRSALRIWLNSAESERSTAKRKADARVETVWNLPQEKAQKSAAESTDTDVGKLTRSGRRSMPVLDWWRSQRLSHSSDGKIVVSDGSSRDELSRATLKAPPDRIFRNTSVVLDSSLQMPIKPERERGKRSQGDEASWTKAQLSSLHAAHMNTPPAAKQFWGVVASHVRGKSPRACQQKWFEHFATPKLRRRRARMNRSSAFGTDAAIGMDTLSSSQEVTKQSVENSSFKTRKQRTCAVPDDIFQATPMRRRHVQLGTDGELSRLRTPKTPVGPTASLNESVPPVNQGQAEVQNGYKRGVSRAYVQAMSKRVRSASATAQNRRARVNTSAKSSSRSLGAVMPKAHATAVSGERIIKASVASSGIVSITSPVSSGDVSEVDLSDSDDSA